MYAPDRFRPTREADLWQVVTEYPFATLCVTAGPDLEITHLPLVSGGPPAGPRRLLGHLARHNPVHRLIGRPGVRAVAVFHGPQGYLSPTDYATDDNLPTWNYVVVHVSGTLYPLPDEQRHEQLARLAALGERHRERTEPGTAPWTLAQAPERMVAEMLPHIFFFALEVQRAEGVFKLSQGRGAADIDAQVAALRARGAPSTGQLANLMAAVRPNDAPDAGLRDDTAGPGPAGSQG
ncbi:MULTISPECIES: FMN-binding negative transcriptional regulator [unclassified Micromonospora]|uniref:FMN-binding negative transcriptional regulator n=1 Tax=unclassified Micromonospora TaxID=2617518 RepID=UPI0036457F51